MKYFLLIILVLLISCSDNQISDYPYSTTPHDCFEYESEILANDGSPDAPELKKFFNFDGPGAGIRWTAMGAAQYFVIEECACPDFTGFINSHQTEEYSIYLDFDSKNLFYRVKAVFNFFDETGWSNVIKY